MSGSDEQALRDITYFTRELLSYEGVLPSGLTAMLRDFASELGSMPFSRWLGIGDATEPELTACYIGQCITDGGFPGGSVLDCCPRRSRYAPGKTHDVIENALRLLEARGEIISRHGRYYVKSTDEGSR